MDVLIFPSRPAEDGSMITDNKRKKPREGAVSDSPINVEDYDTVTPLTQ